MMDIIASALCFLLTCIVGYWAIRSRREAINIQLELEEARKLRHELEEARELRHKSGEEEGR